MDLTRFLETAVPGTDDSHSLEARLFNRTTASTEGLFTAVGDVIRNFRHGRKVKIGGRGGNITTSWVSETVKDIQNTYLDDAWLNKRRFVTGEVQLDDRAICLTERGKPTDSYKHLVDVTVHEAITATTKYCDALTAFQRKVRPVFKALDAKVFTEEAYQQLGNLPALFDTPAPVMEFELTAGGASSKRYTDRRNPMNAFMETDGTHFPALDYGGVMECAQGVITLLGCAGKIHSMEAETGTVDVLFKYGSESPVEDALLKAMAETDDPSQLTVLKKWDALRRKVDERYHDDLLPIDDVLGEIIRALAQLIDRSVK